MIPHIYHINEVPQPRDGQRAALDALGALDVTGNRGLYIHGKTGRGKSYLVGCWAWRYFTSSAKARVVWADWRQMVRDARSRYRDGETGDKASDAIQAALHAPVLVLDDFGAGRLTPAIEDLADEVFDFRYTWQLVTVVTSNLPPVARKDGEPSVKATFGDRVFSRVAGLCEPVRVGGGDGRTS